ncbi:MAG: DNA repair protein RecO [Phycisphaeraceae bacterium]
MARLIDQAIVLRSTDWSETSQLVTLLTRSQGRLRGLAKGSKRLSPSAIARYSGGIELLTYGQIVATTRASSDLATLTEWDLQDDHRHLRTHLPAQRAALVAADLTPRFFEDHDPHPVLFDALAGCLRELAAPERVAGALLVYLWTLLTEAGYQPRTDADVHTNAELPGRSAVWFDPMAGGFTTARREDPWRVRPGTLGLLQGLHRDRAVAEGGDAETVSRATRLLTAYARELLQTETEAMRLVLGGGGR